MTRSELLERAKPILFNTEMVRAIQDGTKTVTRRVLKLQPYEECIGENIHEFVRDSDLGGNFTGFVCRKCGCGVCAPHGKYPVGSSWIRPKYKADDILYVRETWGRIGPVSDLDYIYKADDPLGTDKWHPSIHMPKEAARIFLRVTGVRVERLQDMRVKDCLAEGVQLTTNEQYDLVIQGERARKRYSWVWDGTIKKSDLTKYGWAANPWVFVIEFERVEV